MHSIWDLWTSSLQECKYTSFFEIGRTGSNFWTGRAQKKCRGLPPDRLSPKSPPKVRGGYLTSSLVLRPLGRQISATCTTGSRGRLPGLPTIGEQSLHRGYQSSSIFFLKYHRRNFLSVSDENQSVETKNEIWMASDYIIL